MLSCDVNTDEGPDSMAQSLESQAFTLDGETFFPEWEDGPVKLTFGREDEGAVTFVLELLDDAILLTGTATDDSFDLQQIIEEGRVTDVVEVGALEIGVGEVIPIDITSQQGASGLEFIFAGASGRRQTAAPLSGLRCRRIVPPSPVFGDGCQSDTQCSNRFVGHSCAGGGGSCAVSESISIPRTEVEFVCCVCLTGASGG